MSGIIGFIGFNNENVFPHLLAGMYGLQHRGQDGAGIGYFNEGRLCEIKANGLWSSIKFENDHTSSGLGFIKYAFSKENKNIALMPYRLPQSFVALDGNHLNNIDEPFVRVEVFEDSLVCSRDFHGVKPLIVGKLEDVWIVSSESCAIETMGGEIVRDVIPGETITINKHGMHSQINAQAKPAHCLFEMVYIARADSLIDGVSVYQARINMGKNLFKEYPVDADLIIGAPDSGMIAALGYSMASGIPYQKALVKNRYINRTFIELDQKIKKDNVNIKLSAIRSLIKGKRCVLVDDSIVRGFTMKRIVNVLKEAGAKEVHLLIASPPLREEDSLSIDVPRKEDLIAHKKTVEAIRQELGSDTLHYLSLDALKEACGNKGYYTHYFDGKELDNGKDNHDDKL